MSVGSGRSIEEIDAILSAAKLDRKDLLPVSQEIAFDDNFSSMEYRLVELDKELMETIRVGNRLVFRGEANESAVLCTEDSTYEIKEAETSNSLLIMEKLAFPEQARRASGSTDSSNSSKSSDSVSNLPVISLEPADERVVEEDEILEVLIRPIHYIAHSYLELKKITPTLSRIRGLLAHSTYKGNIAEDEAVHKDDIMTLEMLLHQVPASVKEIEAYLESIKVLYINGCVQQIDEDYLFRILSLIITCVDENSWSTDRIIKSVILESVSAPLFVLEKIFEWFFQPNTDSDTVGVFRFNEQAICRFLGEVLLKPVGRFNLREFLKVWQQSVPEGMKVNFKQLEGLAVTSSDNSPAVIWHFPEYNLPEAATDRFAVLFETKPKWKLEEISPFLRSLATATQSVGILLTKFSRVTNVNGVKYYSSKHSK